MTSYQPVRESHGQRRELEKAFADLTVYGTAVMRNGRYVDMITMYW
jgi:hypothetical protein